MNIAHVIWSFSIGGAETMLVDIISEQIVLGSNVTLFIINRDYDDDLINSINSKAVIKLIERPKGSKSMLYFIELNRCLMNGRYDAIHCHNYSLYKILVPFMRNKIYLTVHGFDEDIRVGCYYKLMFCISKSIYQYLVSKGIKNIVLVYNGVNSDKLLLKKRFNDKIKLVCIGRLQHKIKGQDVLLRAFELIVKEFDDVSLSFIGDGASYNYLMDLTEKLSLRDKVQFIGSESRDQLYKSLFKYDLLVQPSYKEGFGLSVIEGMIAGVPVITSVASGLAEITKNGKYAAAIVNNQEPDAYYNAIKRVIKSIKVLDSELIKSVQCARLYAINNYSISRVAQEYINYYQ